MNELFFGRTYYLNLLQKRINDLKDGYRQNLAIIGDELIGKTTLILKVLDSYYDPRIVFVYIEPRTEKLQSFAKRFIGILLFNFLINSGTPLHQDLDYLLNKAKSYIPKTYEKIQKILLALKSGKKNNVLSEIFLLTDSLYQETGKNCVIILDEFQNLERLKIKNLYRDWRKILILQKNTLYILLSSLKYKAMSILTKELSLLFGNFEIVTLEPFDIQTSYAYLQERLKAITFEKNQFDFLIYFTGGIPFYLDVIADAIKSQPQTKITEILENLLFLPTGILNQRFQAILDKLSSLSSGADYIHILSLIANGATKTKELSYKLNKNKKDLEAKLSFLVEKNYLSRNGDFVFFNDRVFSFWLKFVYQQKALSLDAFTKRQRENFREKIEELIKEFSADSQRPLLERLKNLFHSFEDDLLQVGKRKIRLSRFKELKPLNFKNKSLPHGLIGRAKDSLWILALRNDNINEDDITEFSQECRRFRYKQLRKIIVSLEAIDPNVHLKALEEKIWTWDINHLNNLLDLYSKPRVISQR